MAPDIKPDRHNWRQFCKEEPLSDEEEVQWQAMAEAIREAEARGSPKLFDFITAEVQAEDEELRRVEDIQTGGWANLVASVDAGRRLKRAEIVAWKQWRSRRIVGGGD